MCNYNYEHLSLTPMSICETSFMVVKDGYHCIFKIILNFHVMIIHQNELSMQVLSFF
jgi:hypothetical protein